MILKKKHTKTIVKLLTIAGIIGMMGNTAMAADISMVGMADEYAAYRLIDLDVTLKTKPVWVCNCGEIVDIDKHDEHATNHLLNSEATNGFERAQPLCGHESEDEHERDCYTYTYTVNEKYADVLRETAAGLDLSWDTDGDKELSDMEVKKGLEAMDAAVSEAYAMKLYENVKDMDPDERATESTHKVFMNVDQGYYLLAGSDTLALLNTDGKDFFTVTSKETIPSVTSKVLIADETEESGYRKIDALDLGKGDIAEIDVTVTLPANVESYKDYGFIIHNKATGLQLAEPLKIYANGEEVKLTGIEHIKEDDCTFHTEVNLNGSTLTTMDDEAVAFDKDMEITFRYPVRLANDFTTKPVGNTIQSWVEYRNNPLEEDSMDVTAKDKVTLFTYTGTLFVVDDAGSHVPGARFTLHKQNGDNWEQVADTGEGKNVSEFEFAALGAGIYKLVETEVPEGYEKLGDVVFSLRAEYDEESDNPALKKLSVFIDDEEVCSGTDGRFSMEVVSAKTAVDPEDPSEEIGRLPSTGETDRYILLFGGVAAMAFGLVSFLRADKKR